MFRANQMSHKTDVLDGVLRRWSITRENFEPSMKAKKVSSINDDDDEVKRRRRRRRWRNRRYMGFGIAGSAPLKTGWS